MEVNKKRWLCGGTAAALALALAVAGIVCWFRSSRVPPPKTSIRIGVALYRGDDTFISTVRAALEERAKAYEQETGIKVVMDIVDAKLNQNTQNSQVERFISLGYDALCVNIVDRSAASIIIDRAMDAGIPVVFFNREPVEEDMERTPRSPRCSRVIFWWTPTKRTPPAWTGTGTAWSATCSWRGRAAIRTP